MVAVIVVHDHLTVVGNTADSEALRSPVDAFKGSERCGDLFPLSAKVMREYGGGSAIERIVRPGHGVVAPSAKYLVLDAHFNARIEGVEINVIVGIFVVAEGVNITRQILAHCVSMSIIMCDEQSTALLGGGQQTRELSERFDDRIEVAVDVKVIFFEVVDEPDDGSVVVEGSIELTRLSDEYPRIAGIGAIAGNGCPAGSAPSTDLRAISPNDEAGIKPAAHEHVAQHRGGRALAMCTGDRHAGAERLDFSLCLGIRKDGDASLFGGELLRMVGADCGGGDYQITVGG